MQRSQKNHQPAPVEKGEATWRWKRYGTSLARGRIWRSRTRAVREGGCFSPGPEFVYFLGRGDVSFVFPYGVVGGPTMTGKAGTGARETII